MINELMNFMVNESTCYGEWDENTLTWSFSLVASHQMVSQFNIDFMRTLYG
jgi:hypothetical protein